MLDAIHAHDHFDAFLIRSRSPVSPCGREIFQAGGVLVIAASWATGIVSVRDMKAWARMVLMILISLSCLGHVHSQQSHAFAQP